MQTNVDGQIILGVEALFTERTAEIALVFVDSLVNFLKDYREELRRNVKNDYLNVSLQKFLVIEAAKRKL